MFLVLLHPAVLVLQQIIKRVRVTMNTHTLLCMQNPYVVAAHFI